MIGTPAYGGMIASRYLTSAIGTSLLLDETLRTEDGRKLPVAWCVIDGESLVHRARNNIVAKFMATKPQLSHFIFIDGDLEWEPRDILRLIGHDLPVVCGVYPKKTEPAEFPFHPLLDENGHAKRNQVTGAIQIANGPTGFMCIKREVFVTMRAAYPQLKFTSDKATSEELEWLYAYFDTYVEEGILWSEDYGFCRRWRALGGEVWCDPEIRLGHIGQRIYQGAVKDLWEAVEPLPEGTERVAGWVVPKGDDWFVPEIRAAVGKPDAPVIDEALAWVGNFDLAIDVGAHIGTWTRPLAARFSRVLAIEPNQAILPALKANIARSENVCVMQAAAWDVPEKVLGWQTGSNSGEFVVERARIPSEAYEDTLEPIEGICIDDLGAENVGLIKVDVEGVELKVLNGAMRTIMEHHPVIVIEEDADRSASRWLSEIGMKEVARYPITLGHTKDNVIMVWPEQASNRLEQVAAE